MIEIMELKTYTEYSTLPPTLTCIVDPEVSRTERERERGRERERERCTKDDERMGSAGNSSARRFALYIAVQ